MTLKVPTTRQEYLDLVGIYENTLWLADVIDTPDHVETQRRRREATQRAIECEKLFEQCKFYIDEDGLWCEKEEK